MNENRRMVTREEVLAAVTAALYDGGKCSADGCMHHAGYQGSGSNDWCGCHYDSEYAAECVGQPDQLPPTPERITDAVMKVISRRQ